MFNRIDRGIVALTIASFLLSGCDRPVSGAALTRGEGSGGRQPKTDQGTDASVDLTVIDAAGIGSENRQKQPHKTESAGSRRPITVFQAKTEGSGSR